MGENHFLYRTCVVHLKKSFTMRLRILVLSALALVCLVIAYVMKLQQATQRSIPIYNPVDIDSSVVDTALRSVGHGHTIAPFQFTNQYNQSVSLADVKGKVFVVEYFFTTCGTICPKMNVQMQRVQKAFENNTKFKILSFTVNPEVDSVSQMKMYAEGHKAIKGQWHFLTGDKKALYKTARTSFFVLKPAEAQNLGDTGSDFIHTNNFVLIDKQLRIRGYYEGTSAKEVDRLIKDIPVLLEE